MHHIEMQLASVKFRIEEKVGRQVVDYLFGRQKEEKEKEKRIKADEQYKKGVLGDLANEIDPRLGIKRSNSGLGIPTLTRSSSTISVTNASKANLHQDGGGEPKKDSKYNIVPTVDAAEMKRRARANLSFGTISLKSTTLILSYVVSVLIVPESKAELFSPILVRNTKACISQTVAISRSNCRICDMLARRGRGRTYSTQ
jgi:hypothetical protein